MNALDKKSIDSFLRVAGGLSKSSSDTNAVTTAGSNPVDSAKGASKIERAVKEGGNLRLILRSNGHEFPANKNNTANENNPEYVVCLAHHAPSDQFILFAFNSTTMPCRLIRYDRDGKVIESGSALTWGEIDAAALVAAVNKCHEGNAAYFDRAACTVSDAEGRGECLRLVHMNHGAKGSDEEMSDSEEEDEDSEEEEEEEYEAIRSVILKELLSNGPKGANFHHPDPSFLLALSSSISKELKRWRYMCNHAPSRSKWPKLPSPSEWDAANVDNDDDAMSGVEKIEFDNIVSKRNSQFRKSVKYCQDAMEKMISLLCKIAERGDDSASTYELGKEGIVSLTTLEFMNQQHAESWPDYHDVFEEIDQTCYEASNEIKNYLMTWDSDSGGISEESDEEESAEEEDTYIEVATKLVNAWIKEDKALLKALSTVVATIDQSLRSEQQSLQSAIDSIKAELDSISSLKKEAERATRLNTVRFVKLWNNSCPEDVEEEPGVRLSPLMPQWTELSLEQHLSFGWWASEHEDPSVMNFVIDIAGLTAYLNRCITDVTDFSTSRSQKKFDSVWAKKMQPAIDSTLESIKTFLELGDLRNASIVSACCLGVFCDGAIIGAVGHWYEHNDDYRENETSDNVTSKFQKLWRKYDPYVAAIALAYFDIESPKREAGSHWFFDALQSGLVYAPCDSSDIHWSNVIIRQTVEYEVWWDRLSHPACGIFFHHGWQHQIFLRLRSCNKKEELSLLGLTNYEAPIVIKARFNMVKKLGRTRDAIAFARVTRGDHECIHYLFDNGLVDEAMVQASASKNVEGLSQLSKDLVSTNPCASVLCIQAHILGVMEGLDTQNNYRGFPEKGIDHLIGILQENWLRPSDVGELPDHCVSSGAPSLRLLTTISLARAFLCAAKSTAEVQAIFEQKYFAECGISPLLATIAIATRARMAGGKSISSDMSLKHLLRKMGLLSMEITDVSGFLTQFQPVVKNLGGMDYLDLVCFLYESAKFLIEEGCRSVFCFTLLLYSSVQIGVRTGCESFALDVIRSLKEVEEDRFEFGFYTSTSPLSSLSACFSALFSNCGYDACQDVQIALLETFLQVKVEHSNSSYHSNIFNRDVHQSRVWMGMAYLHHHGRKAAIDAIVSSIISNQLGDSDTDEVILQTLRSLAEVDEARGGNHTMESYVNSAKREQFTEKERDEITKGFISRVLETAPFLAATTIADLIRQYREIDPLFLVCDSTDLETKLSSASEFKLALSKRASLFVTCTIMHYVHDNTYTVLELGLSWLRNALYSGDFIQFDNSEKRGWSQSRYEEERDYQMFLSADAWSNSYLYRNAHKILEGRPKLAAKALVAVLEAKALLALEETPRISHLCREALVLCRILEFLLEPTLNGIAAVDDAWRNSQLREDQLPPVLQPSKLVSFIMDPEWSLRPDYSAKPEVLEEDYVSSTAFLDDRVAIAVNYGHITGAASLCAKALNNEFWTKLSDRSRRWSISYNCGKNIRRVLRACLHVINGAITSREDLPEDYVNHALHMVLSMNWFRACSKCSPNSSSVNMHAQQLVVCIDSVALVHDIALAWSDLLDQTKSPFGQSLSHCLNVLRCVSRCIHILEEGNFLTSQCDECYLRHDITHSENDDDSGNEDDVTDEQIQPRKKRKLLESSTAGSYFKELEGYAVQLHMKEQCDWCIDATRRIEKSRRISDCIDAIHRIGDNNIIHV